jgi:vancomycin resistance protein YoaR
MPNIFSYIKSSLIARWSLIIVLVLVVIIGGPMSANAYINNKYENVFLPGMTIADIDISNLTLEEARTKVQQQVDLFQQEGFVYNGQDKTESISPNVVSLGSTESLYSLIDWEVTKSLEAATAIQSDQSLAKLFTKLNVLITGEEFPILYSWDRKQHLDLLQQFFVDVLPNKQEASFVFLEENLDITPSQTGQTFDFKSALDQTEKQIKTLQTSVINLEVIEDYPEVTVDVIESLQDKIIAMTQRGGLYLTYDQQDWFVPIEDWKKWLKIKADLGESYIGIDQELMQQYLADEEILEEVEIPVQDAKFQLEDGRVTEFLDGHEGVLIDWPQTIASLESIIHKSGELEIELLTNIEYPKILNKEVNDLGIVELLGTGRSDYSGSPYNRVHNIGVGSDTLTGILIPPDEEFSLMQTLGDITGEQGYLQELVIKGGETVPEFGGGLCQIGTTVFRGALSAGLPITERRNHFYRVPYYEPAGTDATIYSPWPDLRFINDTGNYILLQGRMVGTELFIDYWGTSDGRVATTTYPNIYNIVAPPETKIIKTMDLEPGEEKCTERAHYGADADFDYTVSFPDGTAREETFFSHYIPWQEVCLIGMTDEEIAASTTPDSIPGNSTSTPPVE